MAFQQSLAGWKQVFNSSHLLKYHMIGKKLLNCDGVHICRRHLYLLSSVNQSSVHKHRSYDGNNNGLNGYLTNRQFISKKLAVTNYNTLCSQYRKQILKHQNQKSLLPHNTIDGHSCRSLNTADIIAASPPKFQPYLRLIRFDKPIGSFLLFWPCAWSISLAAEAGHLPDLYMLGLFGVGAFIMRGAGCIINDMWDKDIDKMVERTKTRPLASGELSQFQALQFLGLNLSVALAILLQLNWFSVFVGASSMSLVIAYPLAKRYTYWPQALLGLTFNYGAMLGWCAVKGGLAAPILPLYAATLCWTLIYDTIYAHQDKYYDMLIGVKSTALKFGDDTKTWLTGFAGGMAGLLCTAGYLCDQTWPYYVGVAATAAHLGHQIYTVDLDNPDSCMAKFKSNIQLGAVLFIATVIGTLLKSTDDEKEQKSIK